MPSTSIRKSEYDPVLNSFSVVCREPQTLWVRGCVAGGLFSLPKRFRKGPFFNDHIRDRFRDRLISDE
jgi:hypothetical protein